MTKILLEIFQKALGHLGSYFLLAFVGLAVLAHSQIFAIPLFLSFVMDLGSVAELGCFVVLVVVVAVVAVIFADLKALIFVVVVALISHVSEELSNLWQRYHPFVPQEAGHPQDLQIRICLPQNLNSAWGDELFLTLNSF